MLELAAAEGLVKSERVAAAQGIPQKFLENILLDLRHAELVTSRRGVEGGYALARPASEISVADVIRAVEGPIATVRGERPDAVEYRGPARALAPVWLDLRAAMRGVSRRRRSETSSPEAAPAERRRLRERGVTRSCDVHDLAGLELEQLNLVARRLHREPLAV